MLMWEALRQATDEASIVRLRARSHCARLLTSAPQFIPSCAESLSEARLSIAPTSGARARPDRDGHG